MGPKLICFVRFVWKNGSLLVSPVFPRHYERHWVSIFGRVQLFICSII